MSDEGIRTFKAQITGGVNSKIDIGIVKYHFEAARLAALSVYTIRAIWRVYQKGTGNGKVTGMSMAVGQASR